MRDARDHDLPVPEHFSKVSTPQKFSGFQSHSYRLYLTSGCSVGILQSQESSRNLDLLVGVTMCSQHFMCTAGGDGGVPVLCVQG